MRYSLIRELDVSNGRGVGISLFVQGCPFHCKGCFNQETWDFNGGKTWTPDIENKFIELANKPYIKRISFLGGEPLADDNVFDVLNLMRRVRFLYPDKKIWLYTGYQADKIMSSALDMFSSCNSFDLARASALYIADVVVDGQFDLSKQDLYNEHIVFAGSTNQRVIDTKASFAENKIVLLK